MKEKSVTQNEKEQLKKRLQQLKYPPVLELSASEKQDVLDEVYKKFPKVMEIFGSWRSSSSSSLKAATELSWLANTPKLDAASSGFSIVGLVLAAANFLYIPFLYLTAILDNKKVPITLKNTWKFAYAAVLLAFAITSLAFPPAAPIIALIGASFGLITSVLALGKLAIKSIVLTVELKRIREKLDATDVKLQDIIKEKNALLLHSDEMDEEVLKERINGLEASYQSEANQYIALQALEKQQTKSFNKIDFMKVMDKCVAIGLASLGLVGLIVAIFYPPVGAGILAGTAIAGAVYGTARFVAPFVWSYFKNNPEPETDVVVKETNEVALVETRAFRKSVQHDTTVEPYQSKNHLFEKESETVNAQTNSVLESGLKNNK